MKTPREILLARHRAADAKLDAIRRSALAAAGEPHLSTHHAATVILRALWRELVFPCRHVWTGLAAVWVLLLIINVAQRDTVSSVTGKPVRAEVTLVSWQVQQRWMSELLAERAAPVDAGRPRPGAARPRTENLESTRVCL